VPPEACNAQWAYAPSFTAAIAFTVIFALLTIAQLILAILHRKPFCWVVIMGVAWELVAFVTRTIGAHDQQSMAYAFSASLFFLLAPLWINAFVYMTAGRLIYTFHPSAEKRVFGIKAISIGKYFVWLDILSFLIQGTGGSMLSPGGSANTMKLGKNIYMTGVGIQEFFIVLFTGLIIGFHLDMLKEERQAGTPGKEFMRSSKGKLGWKWLTYALYAVLLLISIRIIFRLVEFSAGADVSNPLPYHEGYALGLDAVPMVLAILILTVVHPGLVLKGPESEFPSRKERKAEKKARKVAKKAEKMERKKGFGVGGNTSYEPVHIENEVTAENMHLTGDVEMGRLRRDDGVGYEAPVNAEGYRYYTSPR
jgi:hypothetical protein